MNKRLEWIDTYKGIVMLMVLFSHIVSFSSFNGFGYENYISVPLRGMMVPAFFFISGYLLNNKRIDFPIFFTHRFRQIVVPYFIFFLINYLFWFFVLKDTYPSDFTWFDPFIGMIEGKAERVSPMQFTMITAFALWFITTLFIAEIYFFAVKKISKNNFYIIISLVILSLVGFFTSYFLNKVGIRPWWNVDVAITATVFYGLGYLLKTNDLIGKIRINNNISKFVIMSLLFLIAIVISISNYSSIAFGKYGNPALYYIGAVSGIVALIFFVQFRFIEKNYFLEYLGKNTYLVLSFHMIAIYFTDYILLNILNIPSTLYTQSLLGILFYIVLLFFIIGLITEIFNRFLPGILGK